MATKQVTLNQITLCADGSIGIQWLKQIIDDDGSIMFSEPHRSVIDFDATDTSQIDSVVTHLQAMGYPVPPAAVTRFKAIVTKFNNIANADPTITATRQAKIVAAKAAADAAVAQQAPAQ